MRKEAGLPTLEALQAEKKRLEHKKRYRRALLSTVGVLAVVAAIAVLLSTIYMPVFRITGTSMEPSLNDGDIIVAMKTRSFSRGQVCGFYFNNKLLLKRVVATAGMWVDVDEDGFVYVDGEKLDEPYVTDRSRGITDLTYPVQVPDGCVFVLGDHRSTSVDSRSSVVGFIKEEETVGQIVLRIWPLRQMGRVQ